MLTLLMAACFSTGWVALVAWPATVTTLMLSSLWTNQRWDLRSRDQLSSNHSSPVGHGELGGVGVPGHAADVRGAPAARVAVLGHQLRRGQLEVRVDGGAE